MPAAKPIYHNMSKPRRYEPPRHLLASDMVLFHGGDDRAGYGKDPTRTWATVNGAPPSHEVVCTRVASSGRGGTRGGRPRSPE